MDPIGLMITQDSELISGQSIDKKVWDSFLAILRASLEESSFDLREIGLLEMVSGKLPTRLSLQLTITEAFEESRSGDDLLYRTPVTTVVLWLEDSFGECPHREKIMHFVYSSFSEKLVRSLMLDLSKFLVARLKRVSSES